MAKPVSLFDDTDDEEDEPLIVQVTAKPVSLFDKEEEEDDLQPSNQPPVPPPPLFTTNKGTSESLNKVDDTSSRRKNPSLFEDEDDDEEENTSKDTSKPSVTPSLFDDQNDDDETNDEEETLQTKKAPSLFEEEDTDIKSDSKSQPPSMTKRGMGFLFRGKDKGASKKPQPLFVNKEREEQTEKEDKRPVEVAKRNIYDDMPSSLFDNDNDDDAVSEEEDEEEGEDSDSHDEGDDAAVALKISKLMKPHTLGLGSIEQTKETRADIEITEEEVVDVSSLSEQLKRERRKVMRLEEMLQKADKKIVSLEKEVRSLKRGDSTDICGAEASQEYRVAQEEKEVSRRRRAAMQQQQRRRKPASKAKKETSCKVPVVEKREEGRDSLSSFDDSDIETTQVTPQEVTLERQTPSPSPVEVTSLELLDREVDEQVCRWAAGKSVVDMLVTLPELWPSVTPKVEHLTVSDVSSSVVRREYLKCVRKVHPDKQKHVASGDVEGKRQFLTAQKLFSALTDSYRMWTDDC